MHIDAVWGRWPRVSGVLSLLLALAAICGIAVTNLFLGFAFAVLSGHGPKGWADVDASVRIYRFRPRVAFPRFPRLRWPAAGSASAGARSRSTGEAGAAESVGEVRSGTGRRGDSRTGAADPPAVQRVGQRMVLPHLAAAPVEVSVDPVGVLTEQLAAWHASGSREETSCLSGIELVAGDRRLGSHISSLLEESVRARIVRQLRQDRRVLQVAAHQFLWFSPGTHPDDGLRPVERIRQMVDSTQFRYGEQMVPAGVFAAVLAVAEGDTPEGLIARLGRALASARESGVRTTHVDRGDGPRPAEPLRLEIAPSECILA